MIMSIKGFVMLNFIPPCKIGDIQHLVCAKCGKRFTHKIQRSFGIIPRRKKPKCPKCGCKDCFRDMMLMY